MNAMPASRWILLCVCILLFMTMLPAHACPPSAERADSAMQETTQSVAEDLSKLAGVPQAEYKKVLSDHLAFEAHQAYQYKLSTIDHPCADYCTGMGCCTSVGIAAEATPLADFLSVAFCHHVRHPTSTPISSVEPIFRPPIH